MKHKILITSVLIAVLILSVLSIANAADKTPPSGGQQPPSGGNMQPPSGGQQPPSGQPPSGNNSKPMKERLEEFMSAKQQYINAKKQCKERVVVTNEEKGTCWNELKPMIIKILMNELALTHDRLIQLKEQNITFDNIEEITSKLQTAKAVFEDESSDKASIKAQAKILEDLIVEIEDQATKDQPEVLLKQMDSIISSSEKLIPKLEGMLKSFKAKGIDTAELESDLENFKSDLEDATKLVADARAKYTSSGSSEDVFATLKEVRSMIVEAKAKLEKAFDTVKAMISNMNQNSGSQDGNNNPDGGNEPPSGGTE